jgi:hypothetical protein
MMFVTTPPNKDPLSGSPVYCEALDFTDLKGSAFVDGNARSLDGAPGGLVTLGPRQGLFVFHPT